MNKSLFSHTHSHSPTSKTLTYFKNTHPIQKHSPNSKTLFISHLELKTENPALHNTNHPYSHSPTSKTPNSKHYSSPTWS